MTNTEIDEELNNTVTGLSNILQEVLIKKGIPQRLLFGSFINALKGNNSSYNNINSNYYYKETNISKITYLKNRYKHKKIK